MTATRSGGGGAQWRRRADTPLAACISGLPRIIALRRRTEICRNPVIVSLRSDSYRSLEDHGFLW
jgi:hypothetical protein